jgi:signal transduction histidine kinase
MVQTIYDIIKAHGGEIKVETKEGEGREFVIEFTNSKRFHER